MNIPSACHCPKTDDAFAVSPATASLEDARIEYVTSGYDHRSFATPRSGLLLPHSGAGGT